VRVARTRNASSPGFRIKWTKCRYIETKSALVTDRQSTDRRWQTRQSVTHRLDDLRKSVTTCTLESAASCRNYQTKGFVIAIKSDELWRPYWMLKPKPSFADMPDELLQNVTIKERFIFEGDKSEDFDSIIESLDGSISGDMVLEAGEGFLLLYRPGHLADSRIIQAMLEMATMIHEKLAQQFNREQSTDLFLKSRTMHQPAS